VNSLTPHIAVTGAAGQVGRELVAPGGTPLTRETLDLASSPEELREAALRCFAGKDAVINCAAWTDVDGAEDPANRAAVERVNATAPGVLAEAASQVGVRFIHVSTDYVFPGTPPEEGREWRTDDPTDPLNVYGATKAAGEKAVLAHGGTVVRTAWVWSGPHAPGRDFVATMAGLAARGVDPKVVDDQTGRSHVRRRSRRRSVVTVTEGGGAAGRPALHEFRGSGHLVRARA
jgi:dTDP-4-dehydrorhamnose reductase